MKKLDSGIYLNDSPKPVIEVCKYASSHPDLIRGLMFNDQTPVLFEFPEKGIWPIHSFFVLFPFDAVYLSESGRVLEIFRSVQPFTLKISNSIPAKYLLEIPNSSIKIKMKDRLLW